jgi:hypothetical protein
VAGSLAGSWAGRQSGGRQPCGQAAGRQVAGRTGSQAAGSLARRQPGGRQLGPASPKFPSLKDLSDIYIYERARTKETDRTRFLRSEDKDIYDF